MKFLGKENETKLEDYPILVDFRDMFPEEVHGFPHKRDLDFTTDLVLGVVIISKEPYQMRTP